jgi:hypothetical protein
MKKEPKTSDVRWLLDHVYNKALAGTNHSWDRINNAMRSALSIAIGAGFVFEWWFSKCVAAANMRAIVSYESWKTRGPFIADGVDCVKCEFSHMTSVRAKERLHVGAKFDWHGCRVTVTSMQAEFVTACSYGTGNETRKVKRRFKITREDIIADRAERKERNEIRSEVNALISSGKTTRTEVENIIGCDTEAQFQAIPLKKLRTAIQSITPTA